MELKDGVTLPNDDSDIDENGDDVVVNIPKNELAELKRQAVEGTQEAQKFMRKDRIREDKFQFIKLASSDKKMAEKIAKEFGEKRSIDQIIKDLKDEKNGSSDEGEDKLSKEEIKAMLQEEKAEDELKSLLKEYKLNKKESEELKTKVMEEFDELIGNRKRTPENVRIYFEKALKLVGANKEDDEDLVAAGLIGGKGAPINTKGKTTINWDELQSSGPKDWYKTKK